MMQGQSSRALKGPNSTNYPPFISMPSERKDPNNLKITKFGTMGSVLNDFPLCAPSCEMGLDEADHDTVAWPNFPIVEPFNDDYCPNFLHELGFAGNENNLASLVQTRNSPQLKAPSIQQDSTSKVLSSVTEVNKFKISEYSPLMHSEHPLPRRGHSDITHSDAGTANRMDLRSSGCCSSPVGGSMGSKLNFPYFSRFAPLSGDVLSSKQRTCNNIRGDIINSHNPVKSTLVNSSEVKLSMTSKLDTLPPLQSEALCRKAGENDKYVDQPFDAVPTEVMEGHGQIPEPSVPPSSVCSGNILNRTSNDRAYSLKRKFQEMGDSDGPSDEAEEESVEDRKITFGYTRSKKSRAAEVHNLSERRRRERINEKMRVLQELIPNCNKVDKASMLDETIEYLKSLQLQVQILSMGTGMYAPPMMLPAAIQHIHRAHMPQFLPMGMGLSSGMGMYDVNYGMTPVPNIQSPCYPLPGPSVSTTPMFHGAVGYSHQCLGPGQEQLMSMPHVPPPFFGSSPTRLPVGHVSTMPGIVDLPLLTPSPSSKEMVPNVCSEKMPDDRANTNEDSG